MWHSLLAALALVFVIEGIMPFIAPDGWRRYILMLLQQDNQALRIMGLISMLLGLLLLYIVQHIIG